MGNVLPDWLIAQLVEHNGMIDPFVDHQVREEAGTGRKLISYGLSSYGYDIRVANEFQIFKRTYDGKLVDPKHFDSSLLETVVGDTCIIPPNSFALARAVEHFDIPRHVVTMCVGKSTYARVGIILNVTPFEPTWRGVPTLEISNTSPVPAVVYANEGIGQVIFFWSDDAPNVAYEDKGGKYQDQKAEIVLPRM